MFVLLALFLGLTEAQAAPAAPDEAAIASIRAGHHDCPACNLSGADLSNQCVKQGNLRRARFDGAKLFMMCMSYADFTGASFRNTDLGGANLAHARLDDADMAGADLSITSIRGTDLTNTHGLTQAQLDKACGDDDTRLPAGMRVHAC